MTKLTYQLTITFTKEVDKPSKKDKALFAAEVYVPLMRVTDSYFKDTPIENKFPDLSLEDVKEDNDSKA